ncbi:DNA-binding Lrp family transcriptional regulator [Microbacterium ginsengiterrae]|uniref:DNA-binding Lrp family transcriptional regulator n=1 Tax=Microbacterium ginsengiterrae TaxID=546115 RepID=A0A7W9FEJ5_9MICO|nr:Lrp/AsnC family transcriptional regulator [Microbacterium ginsengiterrae]MBB5744404.1 DNA-binding Lrp family transcriptional regulator [Microbacterium ginsengiterrae]
MSDAKQGRDLVELDRRIVVALQQDGRASWTSIAEFAGAPVSTVTRRGQQLLAEGTVSVGIVPTLGSEGHVESFFIRIDCTPGAQLQVAEALVESRYVRFVTLVTGKFDILAELVIPGDSANYAQVLTGLQAIPGVERWRSDLLTHVYKVSFDWGRQLYDAHADEPSDPISFMPPPNTCEPSHFDDTDRAIVDVLSVDGRASFLSIARKLGVNESSVRRRYERMRAAGCLTTVTMVPSSAIGMSAETLLMLRVEPSRLRTVAHTLAQHVSVRFLAAALEENTLYCEIILPSTESLHDFMTGTIAHLKGVRGWNASMELVFMKRGFIETPWWRSQVGLPPAE